MRARIKKAVIDPTRRDEKGRIIVEAPLNAIYEATALSLYLPGEGKMGVNPRVEPLQTAIRNCGGELPLFLNGKRTASGAELFHILRGHKDYYVSKADSKIQGDNLDKLAELVRGATLVDLCSGHALPLVDLLEKLPTEDWPAQIRVNDLIQENLDTGASNLKGVAEKRKVDSFERNIFGDPGNILNELFWYRLRGPLHSRDEQSVVMMHGGTFNDFNLDEMRKILRFTHLLPTTTTFIFYIDNTTHDETLRKAYDNYALRQLVLAGAEHCLHPPITSQASSLNAHALNVAITRPWIEFEEDGANKNVKMSVTDDRYNLRYTSHVTKMPSNSTISDVFREEKTIMLDRWLYKEPERFPNADYSAYVFKADQTIKPLVP